MSDACRARLAGGGVGAAADWLSLAAAPAFATMALAIAHLGGGMAPVCMAGHGSLMSGMAPMYLIMGAVHSGPWLRLIAGRRS